jgi:hypothetical protein
MEKNSWAGRKLCIFNVVFHLSKSISYIQGAQKLDGDYQTLNTIAAMLGRLAILAFVIERALDFVFDHQLVRRHLKGRGIKPVIALILCEVFCFYRGEDLLAALYGEDAQFLGTAITGLFLAGGSGAAMSLFSNVLGISQAVRRQKLETATMERDLRLSELQVRVDAARAATDREYMNAGNGVQKFRSARSINEGMSGNDIAALQSLLQSLGYLDAPYSVGKFCDATDTAVKTYQKYMGLLPDGSVGPVTRSHLTTRRCGVADIALSNASGIAASVMCKWKSRVVTYAFLNTTPDLPLDRCRQLIAEAFSAWAGVCNIEFEERSSLENVNILISWQRPSDFAEIGPADVFAFAFKPPPCGQDRAGEIIFDISDTWLDDDYSAGADGRHLRLVATHEIGHAIGLDHMADKQDVMFAYPEYAGLRQLSENDAYAAQQIYS